MSTVKILARNFADTCELYNSGSSYAASGFPLKNMLVYNNSLVFKSNGSATVEFNGNFSCADVFGVGNIYPKTDYDFSDGSSITDYFQFYGASSYSIAVDSGDVPLENKNILRLVAASYTSMSFSNPIGTIGFRAMPYQIGFFRKNTYYFVSFYARVTGASVSTSGGFSDSMGIGTWSTNPALNAAWQRYSYRALIPDSVPDISTQAGWMVFKNAAAITNLQNLEISGFMVESSGIISTGAPRVWSPSISSLSPPINFFSLYGILGITELDYMKVRLRLYDNYNQFSPMTYDSGDCDVIPPYQNSDDTFYRTRDAQYGFGQRHYTLNVPAENHAKSFKITIQFDQSKVFSIRRLYIGNAFELDGQPSFGMKYQFVDDSDQIVVGDSVVSFGREKYRKFFIPLRQLTDRDKWILYMAYQYCGKFRDLFVSVFAGDGDRRELYGACACKFSDNLELQQDSAGRISTQLNFIEC